MLLLSNLTGTSLALRVVFPLCPSPWRGSRQDRGTRTDFLFSGFTTLEGHSRTSSLEGPGYGGESGLPSIHPCCLHSFRQAASL